MRVLLPHTTALSGCLDGLSPAKPVVYDVTLAAAGYSGEVPCGRPPSDWGILRALATGRAWDGERGKPCVEPSCACRPGTMAAAAGGGGASRASGSSLHGPAGSSSSGGRSINVGGDIASTNTCNDSTCMCRTSAGGLGSAAAAQPMGFCTDHVGDSVNRGRGVGVGGGGARPSDRRGVARSLSVGGMSRNMTCGDWTEGTGIGLGFDDGGLGRGGGEAEGGRIGDKWGRGCQDIHVRIKRYSLEEVVGNTNWLDDRWAEKERLLAYFSCNQVKRLMK